MRSLSAEEAELWARVASTIRPLTGSIPVTKVSEKPMEIAPPVRSGRPLPERIAQATSTPIRNGTLDGSWDKKLRGGTVVPDRVIDLHGMNLDRAWAAIDRGLDQAIARGDRVILLITGHHRPAEPPIQRGRIRAAVHDWLAASRHARDIVAVRGAHRRHGGGGSLYLILRRPTPRR